MGVKIGSSEPEVSKGVVSPRRVDIPEREFAFVLVFVPRGFLVYFVLHCRSVNVYMESNIVPIIVNSEMDAYGFNLATPSDSEPSTLSSVSAPPGLKHIRPRWDIVWLYPKLGKLTNCEITARKMTLPRDRLGLRIDH
ncbi:predicted protein [Histoplasma capsulatum H143]|uniref:Uncharacterized protein n=1 Tax=Ajellomyces capsulatus (strain H143) TaxID=544712 RepID=C6H699_AJECH|nr:predicted protein [Histoplasma capsulatum H143]